MATPLAEFREELERSASDFGVSFQSAHLARLSSYYDLLLKWNARLHLVAPCSPREFATRHVLESLLLTKYLPAGAKIVDVGSGAGLPIIPCLLVREDLSATLIEASAKKGVFLQEAIRSISPASRTRLVVGRFEDVPAPEVDFLTCRALDRFTEMLPRLIEWAPRSTKLFFTGESLRDQISLLFPSVRVERIPHSEKRFLIIARPESRSNG